MDDPAAPRPPAPALTPRAEAERRARLDREAQALRANLRRRKQQSRDRAATPAADGPDAADPPAGAGG